MRELLTRSGPNAVRIAEHQHADSLDEHHHRVAAANERHGLVDRVPQVVERRKRHLALLGAGLGFRMKMKRYAVDVALQLLSKHVEHQLTILRVTVHKKDVHSSC